MSNLLNSKDDIQRFFHHKGVMSWSATMQEPYGALKLSNTLSMRAGNALCIFHTSVDQDTQETDSRPINSSLTTPIPMLTEN
jgi:hypothetical protein